MHDLDATVVSVTGRNTRTNKTIWDVVLSDGQTYTTFQQPLANKAFALQGQAATARVDVKQNGQYTNYNLEDIAPQGQLAPMAMPAAPGTPATQAPPMAQPAQGASPPMAQGGRGGGGMSDEDKARISRFASQGTAFEFIGSLYAGLGGEALPDAIKYAKQLTAELLAHGYTGSYDGPNPTQAPPQTASEVAAGVNEVAGDGVVQQGSEIPWHQ